MRKVRFLVGSPPYNQGEAAIVSDERARQYTAGKIATDEGEAKLEGGVAFVAAPEAPPKDKMVRSGTKKAAPAGGEG